MPTTEMTNVEEIMKTKYACKELITKVVFDPILSTELIDIVSVDLYNNKLINIESFSFNDQYKTIDLQFKLNKPMMYEAVLENAIYPAFRNFYLYLIHNTRDYYNMYNIDPVNTEIFKHVVLNDVESICGSTFSLFSILLLANNGNTYNIRVLLV